MSGQRPILTVEDATTASIFVTVLTRGPIPRSEIAQRLGLTAGTISRAVRPLLEAGYLVEEEAGVLSRPGRPVVPLRVVADREFVIGAKLAGERVIAVVVDLLANIKAVREAELTDHSVQAAVSVVAGLIGELRAEVAQSGGNVTRLGVGLGGHVDTAHGLVHYAPFLGWREVPLAGLLSAASGLPTVIENDVNSLTVAEQWFGAGIDVPSFALVTIGAGVGCGLVVKGALVHGAAGLAGELGHVPIEPGGPSCRCGNSGCVEAIASEEAILRRVRTATGRTDLDITGAAALAREGDDRAVAEFVRAGHALGRALAIVANLVNPHRILLSGEGLAASDLFETAARESFATHAFGQAVECDIITRPLPDRTWARGAAAVAIQHLFIQSTSSTGR